MKLETITATLADGYKQLQPDTFRTSAEITTARRDNTELRQRWFYTANTGLYRQTEQGLQYGIGGRQAFNAIAGANIDNFCRQLLDNHNYTLTPEQAQSLDALDIVWANPDDLRLQGTEKEWRSFEINPSNPDALNSAQRALAEAAYGKEDFEENMQMLAEAGKTPKIYVLAPDYVKGKIEQGQAIARACWLDIFDYLSYFGAGSGYVGSNVGLRGVRLEKVREADAQKLVSLTETSLHEVLANYLGPAVLEQAKADVAELYQ